MIDIKIVYEDENLLIFDKPAGLVVNRSSTQKKDTLQDWLLDKYPQYYKPENIPEEHAEFYSRAGIAHRIDKNTSGIIVVTKSPDILVKIQTQFKNHEVEKKYLTLVFGQVKDIKIGEIFEINAPILRNPRNRVKFAVSSEGKESVTQFKLLRILEDESKNIFSYLECYPKTGRTHQIRVHLTALGHPIVGDEEYSGKIRFKNNYDLISRQFLHSSYIKLIDPAKKNHEIVVESSLPNDMQSVLDSMKEVNPV